MKISLFAAYKTTYTETVLKKSNETNPETKGASTKSKTSSNLRRNSRVLGPEAVKDFFEKETPSLGQVEGLLRSWSGLLEREPGVLRIETIAKLLHKLNKFAREDPEYISVIYRQNPSKGHISKFIQKIEFLLSKENFVISTDILSEIIYGLEHLAEISPKLIASIEQRISRTPSPKGAAFLSRAFKGLRHHRNLPPGLISKLIDIAIGTNDPKKLEAVLIDFFYSARNFGLNAGDLEKLLQAISKHKNFFKGETFIKLHQGAKLREHYGKEGDLVELLVKVEGFRSALPSESVSRGERTITKYLKGNLPETFTVTRGEWIDGFEIDCLIKQNDGSTWIVEIDGPSHQATKFYDQVRDQYLRERYNIKTLRIDLSIGGWKRPLQDLVSQITTPTTKPIRKVKKELKKSELQILPKIKG